MTESQTPSLRVVSLHGVAGGSGRTTLSLLLADYFAQERPALVVELDPRSATLADALTLHAPGWMPGARDLATAPTLYEELGRTRLLMTDRFDLPCLEDLTEHDAVHPHALAWRLGDGNAGSGRVFVVPSGLSPHTLFTQSEMYTECLPPLLDAVVRHLPDEDGFATVVLDCGPGLSIDETGLGDDFAKTTAAAMETVASLTWTPVVVATPRRAELRALERVVRRLRDDPFYRRAVYVLNQADSDLGAAVALSRRVENGDLSGTLWAGAKLSDLGRAIVEDGAVFSLDAKCRWPHGALLTADGFHSIPRLGAAIVASEQRAASEASDEEG